MSIPTYHSWYDARRRCTDPRRPEYRDYGGRGIVMCESWAKSFQAFLADVGECPPNHTIERINNNGNYEPGNVHWRPRSDQARNRRITRTLTFNGQTLSIAEWAEKTGLPFRTLKARIDKYGWDVDKALTTPGKKRA